VTIAQEDYVTHQHGLFSLVVAKVLSKFMPIIQVRDDRDWFGSNHRQANIIAGEAWVRADATLFKDELAIQMCARMRACTCNWARRDVGWLTSYQNAAFGLCIAPILATSTRW
jgi:hypothetical protein